MFSQRPVCDVQENQADRAKRASLEPLIAELAAIAR